VHQDFAEVGRRCVQGLLEQIHDAHAEPGTVLVPTTLIDRASTAPPP
jgi:DNA-binding LacI/PurR family transcriptional regulator